MPLTPLVFNDKEAKRDRGIGGFGFVALRCTFECNWGPPAANPNDSLSRPSSSSASLETMTDLPKLPLANEVLTGDVGEKRLEPPNSPLPRPGVPLGGDIFSMFWKLYRDCRTLAVALAIPFVMGPCRTEALSIVLRRDPIAPGRASCGNISTTSVASFVALRFPFKRSHASFAPSYVWKCATAIAKPLSSLYLA
jgi:hypothetical protein